MATNWNQVEQAAIQAARNVLGAEWDTVSSGASHAIANLLSTAAYIESQLNNVTPQQAAFISSQQKSALQNILLSYSNIGLVIVQDTISAVLTTVIQMVPALVGFI